MLIFSLLKFWKSTKLFKIESFFQNGRVCWMDRKFLVMCILLNISLLSAVCFLWHAFGMKGGE
ncbi:hypothetical protein F3B77_25670 [Bacteroides ovatus]|uniref:Uncharacterized protein n=1 Tax=Bacteroides ovatus TaxID=28116 RepID=A0A1Y4PCE0_BACOV|nr:hypothetical protein F2X73_16730 [Alistipes onderdonkii]KAA3939026.1 hypothetical protein F3F30_20645 [Bacteroides ovatus]RGE76595.1 hypothetical protein DXA11_21965 [Bacteroides sp. AM56-10ce]RJU39701.1 hypothetical protein DXA24_18345 [Bacteroides sp. CF01-10NS]KAA3945515.1 hypothetical protein F3F24_21820 [Bacteroides ovatus]